MQVRHQQDLPYSTARQLFEQLETFAAAPVTTEDVLKQLRGRRAQRNTCQGYCNLRGTILTLLTLVETGKYSLTPRRAVMGAWNPWDNPSYCWVVICKNAKAHRETNVMFGHKIPLAATDAFAQLPVSQPFLVRCDECGAQHSYEPKNVLRLELELPTSFTPHPGFA